MTPAELEAATWQQMAAEITRLQERVDALFDFVADFASAKIDPLPMPRVRHPADEPDPAVDAETVWVWQREAKDLAAWVATK